MDSYYEYYDANCVPEGRGLINTGAICWFNSLLQVLIGLPAFNKQLARNIHNVSPPGVAMLKLLEKSDGQQPAGSVGQSATGSTGSTGSVGQPTSASTINSKILSLMNTNQTKIFEGTSQECVDEGFTFFLDLLKCNAISDVFKTVYEYSVTCPKCEKVTSKAKDVSYRIQMTPYRDIKTPTYFCNYLQLHPSLIDSYRCPECQETSLEVWRKERLTWVSEVIWITFNKFSNLRGTVYYPERLTFAGPKTLTYGLVGTIEHSGTLNSGHYWARSLRGNEWKTFNDSSVTTDYTYGKPTENTFVAVYHMIRD